MQRVGISKIKFKFGEKFNHQIIIDIIFEKLNIKYIMSINLIIENCSEKNLVKIYIISNGYNG